jgi:hypothetical protein
LKLGGLRRRAAAKRSLLPRHRPMPMHHAYTRPTAKGLRLYRIGNSCQQGFQVRSPFAPLLRQLSALHVAILSSPLSIAWRSSLHWSDAPISFRFFLLRTPLCSTRDTTNSESPYALPHPIVPDTTTTSHSLPF